MIDILFSNPIAFAIIFPALLLAITIHEFAHAWMADKLGDPTPRYQGRVTLDPRAHLDPIGTAAIFLTSFGWGKPVQFDPYNLKNPSRDTALVALAGPASNLILATALGLLLKLGLLGGILAVAAYQIVFINVILAIFNLVPIYPLDGSKIIVPLLPKDSAWEYENFMKRYGMFILIFMIIPWNGASPISQLIGPVISLVTMLLT